MKYYVHVHCIDYNKLDVIISVISVISDKSHQSFPPIFSLVHVESGDHEINSTVHDVILLNKKLIIVLLILCHFHYLLLFDHAMPFHSLHQYTGSFQFTSSRLLQSLLLIHSLITALLRNNCTNPLSFYTGYIYGCIKLILLFITFKIQTYMGGNTM